MKTNIVTIFKNSSDSYDLNLARILILLQTLFYKDEVKGFSKLAKLDFYLRYPVYLERTLKRLGKSYSKVKVSNLERQTIESSMVAYNFGPWDFRYRKFINILIAKDLVYIFNEKKTINIGITEKGTEVVKELLEIEGNKIHEERARLIKTHLNKSGSQLSKIIFKTLPELREMSLGNEITYANKT